MKYLSLSNPQLRIWYTENMHPDTAINCIGGIIIFKGKMDLNILQQAIKNCIKKNEALRLQLIEIDGEIRQFVPVYQDVPLKEMDFTGSDNGKADAFLWADQEFRTPFKTINSPLHSFILLKISANISGLFIKLHHIIADGWSVALLTARIYEEYLLLKTGNGQYVEKAAPGYLEFLKKERDYLESENFHSNKQFWNEKFSFLPEKVIPYDRFSVEGARIKCFINSDISDRLRKYLKTRNISINTYFIGALIIYLNKKYKKNDWIIGIPTLNRWDATDKLTIGMYTGSMAFRYNLISDTLLIPAYFNYITRELKTHYANQKYPYNYLANDLELSKRGYNSLFDICVNYYKTRHANSIDGATIENEELYNGHQTYSLQLIVREWMDDDSLEIDLDYKTSVYSEDMVLEIYNSILYLTEIIINDDNIEIGSLELNTLSKKSLFDGSNQVQSSQEDFENNIISLFKHQVAISPENVAVSYGTREISYSEFNKIVNRIAFYLHQKGVTSGSRVCLSCNHAPESLACVLAILQCGGLFVPVDVNLPAVRKQYIIENVAAEFYITEIDSKQDDYNKCIIISFRELLIWDKELEYLEYPALSAGSLAYIMYTSGSTGKPKGVMINHGNLINYITWAAKTYISGGDDIFALYTSPGFDLTITSMFVPLISGAQVRIYSSNDYGHALLDVLRENKATIIKLTPAHALLIANYDGTITSVKRYILGGEDLKVALAKELFKKSGHEVKIYNEYGPTEATVGCMIYSFEYDSDTVGLSVPIGHAIDNTTIYLLDENRHQVLPGISGEIYIGGRSVSTGYFNNSELTNKSFIKNPFGNGFLYKTGDFARVNVKGEIIFTGRNDNQVKLNGYRIELGEIEKVLLLNPSIAAAYVLNQFDAGGQSFIVAYVIRKDNISEAEIRNFSSQHLPAYMVPLYFVFPEAIPMTINGKIDLSQLQVSQEILEQPINSEQPTTEFDNIFLPLIRGILKNESISAYDNFYFVGGDSIKAIQIASRLLSLGYRIKVNDILGNPVIADFINKIEKAEPEIAARNYFAEQGNIPITPVVRWFLDQRFQDEGYYTQSALLNLNDQNKINSTDLSKALTFLIDHHRSLLINYDREKDVLFYNEEHRNKLVPVVEYDLVKMDPALQKCEIERLAQNIKASFHIEHDLLLKAAFFNLGNSEMLLLVIHHLITDGISWRIILEDVELLLKQIKNELPFKLPEKTCSYKQWAESLHEQYFYTPAESELLKFGKKEGARENILPGNVFSPQQKPTKNHVYNNLLNYKDTDWLLTKANEKYHTTPNELLLIAVTITLKSLFGKGSVTIEIENHGRTSEKVNINRTIGWFMQFNVVEISVVQNEIDEQIMSIKEQLRSYSFQDPRFSIIRDIFKSIEYDTNLVRFNYLGNFDNIMTGDFFELSDWSTGPDISELNKLSCLLELNFWIAKGCLHVKAAASEMFYSKYDIEDVCRQYKSSLLRILDHIRSKEETVFTPSDFELISVSQKELDDLFD
jgi:amino acid adenylation domain-containing protein/non-ribosomal peptide synthase protein (TIGR01720 family)